nr:serine hydrolase [Rhodoligotrophos appendicifer]
MAAPSREAYAAVIQKAAELDPLRTLIIAKDGDVVGEQAYGGASLSAPRNIKSASKSVVSALVGIAIDKGVLSDTDQKIAPLLKRDLPQDADPRLEDVTIGNLLSMQAGLGRTSGPNYGRWVSSANWVRSALAQPFADDPGGQMLYSTGSTHLLSAILTRETGRSTFALAQDWLGPVDGFAISAWARDPQGVYLGGNEMAMRPSSLLAFGELYRNGGKTPEGQQVVPAAWIQQSWQQRTTSRYNGDGYGYGWFLRRIADHDVRYAWGYGGQMLYIIPSLELTVVITSDPGQPSARTGYRDGLHGLVAEIIAETEAGGGRS